MGSKKARQSSSVKLTEPLRGYAQQQLGDVADLYQQYQGMPLPSTYVGISDPRQEALGMVGGLARQGAVSSTAIPEWQRIASGYYLDPAQNPYFERWAGAAAAPIRSRFTGSGRSGGGLALQAELDARTGMASQMYGRERALQQQALGMAPTMEALQYAPAGRLEMVGRQQEADEMARRQEEMRQFQWPWMLSQMYGEQLRASPLTGESVARSKTVQDFDWGGFLASLATSAVGGFAGGFSGGLGSGLGGGFG